MIWYVSTNVIWPYQVLHWTSWKDSYIKNNFCLQFCINDATRKKLTSVFNGRFYPLSIVEVHPASSDCNFARPNHSESECPCVRLVELHSQPGLGLRLPRVITEPLGLMGAGRVSMGLRTCVKEVRRRRFGRLSLASHTELHFNCLQ